MTEVNLISHKKKFGPVPYTHTEVEVYGYRFTSGGWPVAGVTITREALTQNQNFERHSMGHTNLSLEEVIFKVRQLTTEFLEYNIFNKNCRHFCVRLIEALKPTRGAAALVYLKSLNYWPEMIYYMTACFIEKFLNCLVNVVEENFVSYVLAHLVAVLILSYSTLFSSFRSV